MLSNVLNKSEIEKDNTWCLFVIGHYTWKISDPNKIPLYLEKLEKNKFKADWAICAFEKEEFICLKEAIKLGGKIRIGFENSLYLPSGEIAQDNETKIKIIKEELNLNWIIFNFWNFVRFYRTNYKSIRSNYKSFRFYIIKIFT